MYNPLSDNAILTSIRDELLRQPLRSLTEVGCEEGAGVYLLYYRGQGGLYAPISLAHDPSAPPIYAGKAEVPGRRTGGDEDADPSSCRSLAKRLREHLSSIKQAEDLRPEEFAVRCRELPQTWIVLAETGLIRQFRPVWNRELSGFGNHGQGGGRGGQKRSAWDKAHPGRPAAMRLDVVGESPAEVRRRISCYLRDCNLEATVPA